MKLLWRIQRYQRHRLIRLANAEYSSHFDMRLAANRCPDPRRAAQFLRHAADELRHAQRLYQLALERGATRDQVYRAKRSVDFQALYLDHSSTALPSVSRSRELHFLRQINAGEARGIKAYQRLSARLRHVDPGLSEAFARLLSDEHAHLNYTQAWIDKLSEESHGDAPSSLREKLERWRRAGQVIVEPIYIFLMSALFIVSGPLRFLHSLPKSSTWVGAETARELDTSNSRGADG